MKTQTRFGIGGRNQERGAIALIVAALWMTLFGLAAFAVDIGYQYTNKRGLQAATDAAVRAGMPSLSSDQVAARDKAILMATANGFTNGGTTTVTVTPTAQQLQVDIGVEQPSFFLKIFGYSTRTLTARSIGKLNGPGTPAIMALGPGGSGSNYGVTFNGNASLNITGDVLSNGVLRYATGPTLTMTDGSVMSPYAGNPQRNLLPIWDNVTGTFGPGGPFGDPFAPLAFGAFPACSFGTSLAVPSSIPAMNWGPGGVLTPGVYCSGGGAPLIVSSPDPCQCIVANGVTFLSDGPININSNAASTFTPAAGAPRQIIAFTTSNNNCAAPATAIHIGQNGYTLTGSLYAPLGCISGGGTNMTINGSVIGSEVSVGMWGTWTFSGGGPGGSGWSMFQ